MTRDNAVELRRLSDSATKHLHALQALKRPMMHWDDLLVLLISKLDSLTLHEWRTSLAGNKLPSLKQLLDFIVYRCQMLEPITRIGSTSARKVEAKSQPNAGHRARPSLNLNATSVKENTSFIIAKISWHFQYHKGS